MYAVVGCGTELHLPFFDPETGHLQVEDLFRGGLAPLVATNRVPANGPIPAGCELDDAGTTVQWEDSGCSTIPCPAANCGGGNDCRTNNRLIDVQMLGSPNLCGVYRVDLLNWGGFAWELYANCSADRVEQFNLYRDVCAALVKFRPRPEVGIANLWFDESQCGAGEAQGSITFENVGCVDASAIELVIEQLPPLPPNPKIIAVDVTTTAPLKILWIYALSATPASLRFRIDPSNQVLECSEDLQSPVRCGQAATLQRQIDLAVCGPKCLSRRFVVGHQLQRRRSSRVSPGRYDRFGTGGLRLERVATLRRSQREIACRQESLRTAHAL